MGRMGSLEEGPVGMAQVARGIMQGWRQKSRGPWRSAWRAAGGKEA